MVYISIEQALKCFSMSISLYLCLINTLRPFPEDHRRRVCVFVEITALCRSVTFAFETVCWCWNQNDINIGSMVVDRYSIHTNKNYQGVPHFGERFHRNKNSKSQNNKGDDDDDYDERTNEQRTKKDTLVLYSLINLYSFHIARDTATGRFSFIKYV